MHAYGVYRHMQFGVVTNNFIKNVGERASERHYSVPLARPLIDDSVLAARSIGARERFFDPYL